MGPTDILKLPKKAKHKLTDIFHEIVESTLAWSRQLMRAWVSLTPKQNWKDRSIAMFALVARLREPLGKASTDSWAAHRTKQAPWGDAVGGSSAAQAALRRLLNDGCTTKLTIAHPSGLMGVSGFYDFLNTASVMKTAQKYEYPCRILVLLVRLHLAPSYLRSRKVVRAR